MLILINLQVELAKYKKDSKKEIKNFNKEEIKENKMGYSMKMGSKEKHSPINFKDKDAMLMYQSPMLRHHHEGRGGKDEIEAENKSDIKLSTIKKKKIDDFPVLNFSKKEIDSISKDSSKQSYDFLYSIVGKPFATTEKPKGSVQSRMDAYLKSIKK
tara:strand:+ start:680 stop:1150 length:471 start_codon:yes stop_codon:yes gene_type:complete